MLVNPSTGGTDPTQKIPDESTIVPGLKLFKVNSKTLEYSVAQTLPADAEEVTLL